MAVDYSKRITLIASDHATANLCHEMFRRLREVLEALDRYTEFLGGIADDDPDTDDKANEYSLQLMLRVMQQYPSHAHFQVDLETLRAFRARIEVVKKLTGKDITGGA